MEDRLRTGAVKHRVRGVGGGRGMEKRHHQDRLGSVPLKPILWPPSVVSDCQDPNSGRSLKVYNMKGKVFDRRPASGQIGWDVRHRCASFREETDLIDRSSYCFEKNLTKPASLFLIP